MRDVLPMEFKVEYTGGTELDEKRVIIGVEVKSKSGDVLFRKFKVYDRNTQSDTLLNWANKIAGRNNKHITLYEED